MLTRYKDLARIGAAAVIAGTLTACGAQSSPGPASTPSTSAAAQGAHYEPVENLCAHVSLDAIVTVLPHVEEGPYIPESIVPELPGIEFASCDAVLGSETEDDRGVFGITVYVFADDAAARVDYDFNRDADAEAVDLDGLGQDAYQVIDSYGDPAIRVLDGNGQFYCNWVTRYGQEVPAADDLLPALVSALHYTLDSLARA